MTGEDILKPPRDQRLYRFLGLVLTASYLGDQRWWGMGDPTICPLFVKFNSTAMRFMPAVVFLFLEFVYLYINFNEISLGLIRMILTHVPFTLMVIVLAVAARLEGFKKIMKQFMDKIHIYNFRDESDFAYKKAFTVDRNIRWTSLTISTLHTISIMGWFIGPFLINYKNAECVRNKTATLQSIIYFYVPFDYEYNYTYWLFMNIVNIYYVTQCVLVVVTSQIIIYAFMFNVLGHIDILKYKIKIIFSDTDTDAEVNMKLIDIVKYHNFILKYFKDLENVFGLSVTTIYLFNLVEDSYFLFEIMYGEPELRITYGFTTFIYMGGLVLMSFALEEFGRKTVDLSDLVYNLPWENMSVRNQKTVLLILFMTQEPLVFKASGGMIAGVKPMISILKSTFSYYVLLKASMKE